MKNKYLISFSIIFILANIFILYDKYINADNNTLASKLKGKILLQVEDKGKAWYVSPSTYARHYLGNPQDAYDLIKKMALGIADDDINLIPLGNLNLLSGFDSDKDGLSDDLEKSLGTNFNSKDSDNDGYEDKNEILNNFNPLGKGKLKYDKKTAQRLAGYFLLQIEKNGEAWYINPMDLKRYYLGRPSDAFTIMRSLSLGISNNNLAKIDIYNVKPEYDSGKIVDLYTRPSDNPNIRKYVDPKNIFSLEYPIGWNINRFSTNPNTVQITDASKDYFTEKKAVIIVAYSKEDKDASIKNFKIASREKAENLLSEEVKLENKNALVQAWQFPSTFEKTTVIEKNRREFLLITLVIPNFNKSYYSDIYDNMIKSIKFIEN